MQRHIVSSVLAFGALLCSATAFSAPAGEITLLTGRATAASADGTIRSLSKGSPVFSREFVSTGSNSFVNIKFADRGAVLIKPNSRFHIEQYDYVPASATPAKKAGAAGQIAAAPQRVSASHAFFRLIKGGFRAVSGLIGKGDRNEYRVSTPVATIGIRGTDYEAILCDEACASDPVIMKLVGITANPRDGLVASVMHGGIGVTTDAAATISSLKSYQTIAKALGIYPAGLVKVANRGQLFRVANEGGNTYNVDEDQTLFFPTGQHHPVHLPGMNPNIDSGLQGYNPNDMCK